MPRRSKQDWYELIMSCRQSGLSDHQWCNENKIAYSTFYYHVSRLRKEACKIPKASKTCTKPVTQEVVRLSLFDEPKKALSPTNANTPETVISLQVNGITINIGNQANAETIGNTLKALQELC